MNHPKREIIQGLITAINTVLPARTVYTVPPKDTPYPYLYLHEEISEEIGSKEEYIWECEYTIEVLHRDISSIDDILSDTEAILSIIKNSPDDITVTGYSVIEVNLVNTSQEEQLQNSYRIDIELIRIRITLNE